MREFKFRAWVGTGMQLFDPFFVEGMRMPNRDGYPFLPWDTFKDWKWMQYTGLKDKNGKEIYEGDIIRYDINTFTNPGFIDFDFAEFRVRRGSFVDSLSSLARHKWELEVIGNIYEHPELLEVKS